MAWRRWTGLIAAAMLLTACGSGNDDPASDATEPVVAASATDSPEAPGTVETESSAPTAPAPAHIDDDGMKHSGLVGAGEFVTNAIEIAPATQQPDVRNYVLQVETDTGIDADAAARQIQGILDSERGWVGYRGIAFNLVSDPAAADLVLTLASPPTVDIGCGALDTRGDWSCSIGSQVFLNSDRWWYATPTWQDYSMDDYRAYLINHEVGHYLGFGHVTCPEPGALSPVMQQQSIYLNGCVPNPWPDVTGEKNG